MSAQHGRVHIKLIWKRSIVRRSTPSEYCIITIDTTMRKIVCNVINVCKLDLLNTFIFMHKIKTGADPAAFHATFKMPSHSYRTRFWSANYSKPKTRLHKSRFWISIRGPAIWNIFVANTEIEFEFSSKTKLLNIEYEIIFF